MADTIPNVEFSPKDILIANWSEQLTAGLKTGKDQIKIKTSTFDGCFYSDINSIVIEFDKLLEQKGYKSRYIHHRKPSGKYYWVIKVLNPQCK
jgi:hypothetical protein